MATLDLTDSDHTYDFRLLPADQPRFWPRWAAMDRGLIVIAEYSDGSWDITTYPGTKSVEVDDLVAADYWWRGGDDYEFEDDRDLKLALIAAGYDAGVFTGGYSDTYGDTYTP